MAQIFNPFERRIIGQCFYVVIDYQRAEDLIEQAKLDAWVVKKATQALLTGELDLESFLDLINEATNFDTDDYLEEVEKNLEDAQQILIAKH